MTKLCHIKRDYLEYFDDSQCIHKYSRRQSEVYYFISKTNTNIFLTYM